MIQCEGRVSFYKELIAETNGQMDDLKKFLNHVNTIIRPDNIIHAHTVGVMGFSQNFFNFLNFSSAVSRFALVTFFFSKRAKVRIFFLHKQLNHYSNVIGEHNLKSGLVMILQNIPSGTQTTAPFAYQNS